MEPSSAIRRRSRAVTAGMLAFAALAGCMARDPYRGTPTPTSAGMNTRDLIDPPAQKDSERLYNLARLVEASDEVRRAAVARADAADPVRRTRPAKNVLCMSGGGAYGAFTAGMLVGWTVAGDRPEFDTVTGISTGAIIAPLAFLGPKYDADIQRFYTEIRTRDVYRKRTLRGLFTEALADNSPLADRIRATLTPELIADLACAHRAGRRLYIGTTEMEAKRFIVWDIGAIAARDGAAGAELIAKILIGSSAIPGFFPASTIPITVDGRDFVEKHGDGGVSQGIFFRPAFTPEGTDERLALAGTRVWCIVAGKLYADPAPQKKRSIGIVGASVSTVIYAQTRGDLTRIYTGCLLSGMDYHLTALPEEFEVTTQATDFSAEPMKRMFNEGCRLARSGQAWRSTPPGTEPGERLRERAGIRLTEQKQGPGAPNSNAGAPGPVPAPAFPGATEK